MKSDLAAWLKDTAEYNDEDRVTQEEYELLEEDRDYVEDREKGIYYTHEDVAWVEYYRIDWNKKRGVFIATCTSCKEEPTFVSKPGKYGRGASARAQVQTHVLRHGRPPIAKPPRFDECPF